MKIGVIGGGAIGLLSAAHLASNHRVTIYVKRQSQKDKINKQGLTLLPGNEIFKVSSLLTSELNREDLFIICVKQHQLEELQSILHLLTAPIVFLQNGMGHIDDLLNYQFKQDLIVGTCEHGAMRTGDNTIRQTGYGKLNLALLQGNYQVLNYVRDCIATDEFPVGLEGDWFTMLAKKLVINAVVNPLTALFQVKNGAILENNHLLTLAKKICFEASVVLELNAEKQWEHVVRVIQLTKENDSSMKIDISNKRTTEIEGISGFLIKHARNEIPFTSFVYKSIKALEWQQGGERD